MRKSLHLLAGAVICVLGTACGGGGSGGSANSSPETTVPPEPTPVDTFTLSGTITASSSQSVDSDTNDPSRLPVSNNVPAFAQPISNPITLGGYVNQPGTGAEGRSRDIGDIDDFFVVEALKGQRITMLVADFEQADADLYLYNSSGTLLDDSINVGEIESVLIPRDGTFFIRASAYAGGTNYNLVIGAPEVTATEAPPEPEIVPWQAIVKYRDESADKSPPGEEMAAALGMQQRGGGRGRNRLLALRRDPGSTHQMGQRLRSAAQRYGVTEDTDGRARWETLMMIKMLRADPRVRHAEPNYRVNALATPNDQRYPLQWHYPLIGLPDAWEITTGDPEVVVAVIDTGVLADHPDLAGQFVDGYDFVRDPGSAADGDGIDPDPQDPGGSFGGGSESFHGTHVSGTVAARGNNRLGVAGIAYSSRVMPLRALGIGGSGTTYDLGQAIRYAAGLANDSGTLPQRRADIINLSLGGAPFLQGTQELFNEVRAAGVMVVAAAGNEASSAPGYPASYNGVISVSAVDTQRRLAAYSNTGANIDVAAPGGDGSIDLNGDGFPDGVHSTGGTIGTTGVNFGYSFLNGTSMAAPHVAGVLALMKSVNPALSPNDIDALLATGALTDDLGLPGRDNLFGHGLINAQRAVFAALEASGNSPADNPRLVSSTTALNFGNNATTLSLVLRNGGKGDLELIRVTGSEPWLKITALEVDGDGLGEYEVSVDRSSLPPGIYTAEINAQSTTNNLTVQVLASAGGADTGTDIGVIYILLYDPVLDEPFAQFATGSNGTSYPFQFTDVPAGDYEIVAGTDADNDLFICDSGEACGAWLTVDQPIQVQVDGDITSLDFPVEYLVSLPAIISANQSTAPTNPYRRAENPSKGVTGGFSRRAE